MSPSEHAAGGRVRGSIDPTTGTHQRQDSVGEIGWYADPDTSQLRYWDGSEWSDPPPFGDDTDKDWYAPSTTEWDGSRWILREDYRHGDGARFGERDRVGGRRASRFARRRRRTRWAAVIVAVLLISASAVAIRVFDAQAQALETVPSPRSDASEVKVQDERGESISDVLG